MSDEDSTNVQFSRNDIIQAIVETLEPRPKNTCEISSLYELVCRNLEVRSNDPRYELIRNIIKPIIISMLYAKVIKWSGTKKTQYRLTNNYQANVDQLINQYDNDIESLVQPIKVSTSDNLPSKPNSSESSDNIPSDEESNIIQFTRNEIIQAIIETLETRRSHGCLVSVLNNLVCRNLDVHNVDQQHDIIRNKIRPVILSLIHSNIIERFGNSRNLSYRLSKDHQAKLYRLIEKHDCEIVYFNSNTNSTMTDNLEPLPDSSEPSENIPPNKKSNIIQFTRNDLRRAVVETHENRPSHSCQTSELPNCVCQHLHIFLHGNKRKTLKSKIRQIIGALVRSNIIRVYRAKNQRYRLAMNYQSKLKNLLKRFDGNDVYYDAAQSDIQPLTKNTLHKDISIVDTNRDKISPVSDSSFQFEENSISEIDDSELSQPKFNLPDLPDQIDPSFYEDDPDEDDWDVDNLENEDFDESEVDPLDILTGKSSNNPRTNQLPTPTPHISTDDFTFKDLRSIIASYIENHPDFESDAVRNKIQMITCMEDVNIFITVAIDRHTSQIAFRAELQNLQVSPEDILDASAVEKFNCIPGQTKSNNHPIIQLRRSVALLHIDSSKVFEAIDDIIDDSETLVELRRSGS